MLRNLDEQEEDEEEETRWGDPFLGAEGIVEPIHRAPVNKSNQEKPANNASSSSRSNSIMSRMALNDNKAGMDGLDKEKINKIILEASKGSRFYENEQKKEAQVNQRIECMMQQLAIITEQQRTAAVAKVDAMVAELEASRSFRRSIVHLDMDAFYAAVEMRDNPALKDKPMAVGGMSMLSTSNYHARRYGVRAAMPGFIAKKLCPELIIAPSNFDKYRAVSEQVREILAIYDPNFCPMSLDEAYFDLTDHLARRKGLSEAERTFEYGEWNKDLTQVGKEGNEGSDEKNDGLQDKEQEGNGRTHSWLPGSNDPPADGIHCALQSDSTGQDTKPKMSTGVASDNAHIVSSSDGNQTMTSSKTDTLGFSTAESTLDNSEHPPASSSGVDKIIPSETATSSRKSRCRCFGFTVEEVVEEIRFRIEQKTQLTASAGIAPNTMLAKICSDKNKPNGQYRILPNRDAVMEFVRELPIRKVSGIGKVTEKLLSALGIQNCTDLFQQRALLHLLFSPTSSHHFLRISLGLGSTRVERDGERKSMSTERTFRELHRPADLYNKCHELCQALAEDLQKEDLMGKTVTIKLKTVKFEVKTKACSVPTYIKTADCIFNVAKDLLRVEINACKPEPLRLRLMGVRLSNLQPCSASSANRQDSITKFFKKRQQSAAPHQQSTEAWPEKDFSSDWNRTPAETVPFAPKMSPESTQMISTSQTSSLARSQIQTKSDDRVSRTCTEKDSFFSDSSASQVIQDELRTRRDYVDDVDGQEATVSCSEIQEDLPIRDQSVESSELVCPVCNVPQLCSDLDAFNEHVDLCLNRGAIHDMLQQQASQEGLCSNRNSTSPTKGKRSSSGPKSAPKRRKQEKTQTNTLDKFFS